MSWKMSCFRKTIFFKYDLNYNDYDEKILKYLIYIIQGIPTWFLGIVSS